MFFLSLLYDLCQTLWKFLHKKRASPDKCEALFGWEAIFSRLRVKLLRGLEKIVRSKEANLRAGGDSERSEDL